MFDDRNINVLAYNIETILAEKLETIISKSDQNTRPRDFYDVFILYTLRMEQIDYNVLAEALLGTSMKRNSMEVISQYKEIVKVIRNSKVMGDYWKNYQKDFAYAEDIDFNQTLNAIEEIFVKTHDNNKGIFN